ncbi:MAG: alpha/beta hydrolase [Proteobacteria bacterium]|nr:alpha/beta hydrolase [Pseudomonadota bacterium]
MKAAIQAGILSLIVICFVTISGAWYISSGLLQPEKTKCDKENYVYCGTPAELGLRYRNTIIRTVDDVAISAWYIPGEKNYPGIVLIPGIGDTRHVGLRYAPSLHAAGFNLLLIDLRNSGKSGGHFNSMGYHERKDVHAAINHLLYRRRASSAGVFGFSTGAGIAILAMAENKNIKVGVFESGFTNFDSVVSNELTRQYGTKASILYPLITGLFQIRSRAEIASLNPQQAIAKISPRPVFVIHGNADPVVDFKQGKSLFVAAKQPKRFWPVFNSGHVQSWQADKQRAEKEIPSFFASHLKFPQPPPVR